MMYYYQMFGFKIKSTFQIPEAVEISETEDYDVFIELGEPPKRDLQEAADGRLCRLDKDVTWFYLEEMGMFYVENGNHIIIHKTGEKLTDLARNSYLTGTTMGLLMFQRGVIPIHSSAVAYKGKCITILGESGAGKSTTSELLLKKGCQFMSDDVSAMRVIEGSVMVSPAFPQQKLCRDAALRQGYSLDDLIYIDENRDKYALRLKNGYEKETLPLGAVVELLVTNEEELTVREVVGVEKLQLLYRNIYRGRAWNEIGIGATAHAHILEIAKNTPMYQFQRPVKGYHTETIAEWIMDNV